MSRKAAAAPPRSLAREERGYQPRPAAPSHSSNPQGGHQPTSGQGTPASPPSDPPNQGTSGNK